MAGVTGDEFDGDEREGGEDAEAEGERHAFGAEGDVGVAAEAVAVAGVVVAAVIVARVVGTGVIVTGLMGRVAVGAVVVAGVWVGGHDSMVTGLGGALNAIWGGGVRSGSG
jgi:hypothetical protein